MFVKMMTCQIKEGMGDTFSTGQRYWSELKDCGGFKAQYGGWSKEKDDVANIIGFWENDYYYQKFMDGQHDLIYEKTDQKGTIASIEVEVMERVIEDIEKFASSWLSSEQSDIQEHWSVTPYKKEEYIYDEQ
ncbi:MAG: DUF4937 domain-containing protein [Anaerobacillus sp.]